MVTLCRDYIKRKTKLLLFCAALIAAGFIGKSHFPKRDYGCHNFGTASIFGVLPVVIQAYQALKVKVVSIEVLVTIAVIGALFIKNLGRILYFCNLLFGA